MPRRIAFRRSALDSTRAPATPWLSARTRTAASSPWLPFVHAAERVDPFDAAALLETYRRLLRALGVEGAVSASCSYNLLVTREWMVLIPRERHEVEGVPVNALGFGGALLVRNRQQLAELRRRGPFDLLRRAGRPRG